MRLQGIIARCRRDYCAFGLRSTLRALAIRAIQRVIRFKVLRAMRVTTVVRTFATIPAGLTADFLDYHTLKRMSADPKYELSPEFLREALNKGDECYAIRDGGEVVSYGWYAQTPTKVSEGLMVSFDPAYVYMYKSFTLGAYRGRRLHAIGKTRALAVYLARGHSGLVSYADDENLSSLKANKRLGCVDLGRIWVMQLFGKRLVFRTPGCAAFAFDVASIRNGRLLRPDVHEPSPIAAHREPSRSMWAQCTLIDYRAGSPPAFRKRHVGMPWGTRSMELLRDGSAPHVPTVESP